MCHNKLSLKKFVFYKSPKVELNVSLVDLSCAQPFGDYPYRTKRCSQLPDCDPDLVKRKVRCCPATDIFQIGCMLMEAFDNRECKGSRKMYHLGSSAKAKRERRPTLPELRETFRNIMEEHFCFSL